MAAAIERGAAGRGAAGGDVRMRDVPGERIAACLARLDRELRSPSEASALLGTVRRAVDTGRLALPVIPTTVSRLLGLLEKEDVELSEIALLVETDPALATKIVGVANSGFYGGVEAVASVQGALLRTGLEQAKNIVAGVAIRSSVFQAPGYRAVMEVIWQRSLATALATLALLENDRRWRDSAFLLGLVHDVGRIILLATAAVPLARRGRPATAGAIEQAGSAIRCELGAIALASWAFDDEMIDAVAWQEQPDACPEPSRPLAAGLYAADTLVNLGMRGWRPGKHAESDRIVAALVEPLGFGLPQMSEVLQLVEGGMSAFARLG